MRLLIIAFLLSSTASASPSIGSTYSLDQCYALALRRSDTVASASELIHQAEERAHESRAAFLPSLNFTTNGLAQQLPTSPLLQNFFSTYQGTAQITARQNLFNGFRDFAALKQHALEKEAATSGKEQAQVQLFQDTALTFYHVLAYEQDLLNYQDEIDASKQRKTNLESRRRAGQAREADTVSIDSSIASLQASLAATRGLLAATRESLTFLTGLPSEAKLQDSEHYPVAPTPLGSWLNQTAERADILQAKASLDAAEESLSRARGGHLPSVDLLGNYYFARPGLYSGINWDVQATLVIPLFAGGLTQAQVRGAASKRNVSELTLHQIQSQADRDVRSAYQTFVADFEQIQRLAQATALSQKTYELLAKENRAGNVTNIDVLQALVNSYVTKLTWNHAQWIAKYNYAKLEALSAKRDLSGRDANAPRSSK